MGRQLSGWCGWTGTVLVSCACAVVSAQPPEKSEAAPNPALGKQLKQMFDSGFVVGPRSSEEAAGRLERIRSTAPDDPRVDYAAGLVLVKQSQMKQARLRFEAAISRSPSPYWPAWRGAIWSQLVEKQFESGLNRLVEFAILVRGSDDAVAASEVPEITENQREASRWIGQILEALVLLPEAKKHRTLIEERQMRVEDALGEELALCLEEGRMLVRNRASDMELAADTVRDNAGQAARRRKRDKELEALDKRDLPQSPEEWKTWIDGILQKLDKQLAQLDREYQSLGKRAEGLNRAYLQASDQFVNVRANMVLMRGQHMGPAAWMVMKQQMVDLSDQMTNCEMEFNTVMDQLAHLADLATNLANQRAHAIERYEQETGEMIPKNPDLEKWVTRAGEKRSKLANKAGAKPAAKDAVAKKRSPTFKSLVPLDLDRERDGLLASYGIPEADAADEEAPANADAGVKLDNRNANPAER